MKYRLLALDLDGTLLNSQKEITPEVRKALAWAKERGVYVVLSTGRIVGEAAEFARELPCEDLMVTAGGTAIATASDERILQSWEMPCEIGAKAVEAVQSRPVRVMIYVGSKIYINEYSNRDFVANYRVEGFHANKIVVEDIAGEIRRNHLNVTKVYAIGERAVLEQALAIPQEVDMGTAGKRLDLRDKLIFTIDGDDAKDFDDAVSLEKLENGHYLLGVHIADVSHYVTPDSPLDAEAFRRGTSVYFPGHVVPMLPFALSNGICSLNPKVDRLAFSALMEVDKDGRRYGAKFAKSVICSKARMTYNKVNKILAGDKGLREEYAFLVETAETMNNLAHALYKRRIERGALELDIPEAEIRVDENGKPVEIRFRERGESEKLIEEFMLQANEAVAEYMCKRELPTVYRVHENPDPDKLRVFASFARPFGYRIDPSKPEDTAQFQTVLRGAKNDPKQRVLPTLLLRSLARARYADECIGHYGLKAKFYLHFTSPIRRYPDLVAHRMLQKALLGEEFTAADETMCEEAADQSTNREQAADNCERDIDKLYIASYMQQFIGEEFDAEVSGVQSFGVFVALENGCEGLIRAELMTGDFYQYDEEHMAMVGRRTGKRFTIGTPLRVKLLAASEVTGQIDFAPAEGSLPVSEKPERAPRDDDRPPFGNRASRRRHSHGRGRSGGQKGKKPPTRKRR